MRLRVGYVGRVQGVGFRAITRSIARRHPVTGWVRNEPDGSVLVEVQGESASVESFLAEVGSMLASNIASTHRADLHEARGESEFVIAY
jgi:acylphosphatase